MINLLPKNQKELLKKGLRSRIIVVSAFLLTAGFGTGLIMLLPSYFLVSNNFYKTNPSSSLSKFKDDNLNQKILDLPNEINSKLVLFQQDINKVSSASYFSKIAELLPSGVQLNSLSFSKNQDYNGKNGTSVLIGGIAANRDALMSFSDLLKKSNMFLIVEVPVSSLTKNKDLPFSINTFIEN